MTVVAPAAAEQQQQSREGEMARDVRLVSAAEMSPQIAEAFAPCKRVVKVVE